MVSPETPADDDPHIHTLAHEMMHMISSGSS